MTAPKPPDACLIFDLASIAQELRDGSPYVRDGLTARTLTRSPDMRIVLVALKAGKTISEHHASVTASVQTLVGHVRLQLPDRGVDVPAGQLVVLGAGLSHDVHAEMDSTFLLTLGWPAEAAEMRAGGAFAHSAIAIDVLAEHEAHDERG